MNHFMMQYILGNKLSVEKEGNTLVDVVKLMMELGGWEGDVSRSDPSPQIHYFSPVKGFVEDMEGYCSLIGMVWDIQVRSCVFCSQKSTTNSVPTSLPWLSPPPYLRKHHIFPLFSQ